jgi:pyruvate dehydrogenase E2 component (dihydrolipoamide acetyltransferase)
MIEFKMPSLGADMEDATLVEWRVKPGDFVKKGDIIAEVDTQKGLIEVEVFDEGFINELMVEPGVKIKVGKVLATILSDPLKVSESMSPANEEVPKKEQSLNETSVPKVEVEIPLNHIRISPLARKIAEENHIQIDSILGTGEGGVITKMDVEKLIHTTHSEIIEEKDKTDATYLTIRSAVAAAMSKSNREIPHFYLEKNVNMHLALQWLRNENKKLDSLSRILPVALFVKAIALGLKKVPELNASWENRLVLKPQINIGFVVSLKGGGLLIPAIHEPDRKSVQAIMHELSDIIPRARALRLRSSELSDSTITMTNLGDHAADSVFGVIYPPQVALIGIGSIIEKPFAEHGMLGVSSFASITLAADHRAIDGHLGSLFLNEVNKNLHNPEML